jgi:hypothetical protein
MVLFFVVKRHYNNQSINQHDAFYQQQQQPL